MKLMKKSQIVIQDGDFTKKGADSVAVFKKYNQNWLFFGCGNTVGIAICFLSNFNEFSLNNEFCCSTSFSICTKWLFNNITY